MSIIHHILHALFVLSPTFLLVAWRGSLEAVSLLAGAIAPPPTSFLLVLDYSCTLLVRSVMQCMLLKANLTMYNAYKSDDDHSSVHAN